MTIALYGKLPVASDFVALGESDASPVLREWLHAAFGSALRIMPEGWDAHYRTAPIWRLFASQGVLAAHAVMGILTPSADRSGRLFPVIAMAPASPAAAAWYESAEQAILDVFAGRILSAHALLERLRAATDAASHVPVSGGDRLDLLLGTGILRSRFSLWWQGPAENPDVTARAFGALPQGGDLMCLLQAPGANPEAQVPEPAISHERLPPWLVTRQHTRGLVMVLVFSATDAGLQAIVETAAQSCPESPSAAERVSFSTTLGRDLRLFAADRARAEHRVLPFRGVAVLWFEPASVAIHVSGKVVVHTNDRVELGGAGIEVDGVVVHRRPGTQDGPLQFVLSDGPMGSMEDDVDELEVVVEGIGAGIRQSMLVVQVKA